MATRHNACTNPALANDNSGWGGESTPTRTAVSGFGRPFAAHYGAGTFMRSAAGAATAGLEYTLSVYLRPDNGLSQGNNIYIEWRDGANGVISYSSTGYTVTSGVVSRASVAATAPAGTATAQLVLDGINYAVTGIDASMVLIEQSSTLEDYFDGDSDGASWDGTPGNSPSTLEDVVSGTLTLALPALTGGLTGEVTVQGALTANLPPLQADMVGAVSVRGELAGTLPALTADLTGQVTVEGQFNGTLPALQGHFAGQVTHIQGVLTMTLPALQGSFTGVSDARRLRPGAMTGRDRPGPTMTARRRGGPRMEGA